MRLAFGRLRQFRETDRVGAAISRQAQVILLALVVASAAALLQTMVLDPAGQPGSTSPLSALDQSVQDFLVRAHPPGTLNGSLIPAAANPQSFITIVAIDERTINELGAYGAGYPRRYHAQVVENLLVAPPRVVAFDVGFFEPTPDDHLLAAAFNHARSLPTPTSIVLGAVGLVSSDHLNARSIDGELAFDSSLSPLTTLAGRADVALANIMPDDRGTIRSIPLVASVEGVERPSLGLAAMAGYLRRPSRLDGRTSSSAQIAGRTIPVEADASFRIAFFGPPSQPYAPNSTFRILSFVDVLRHRIDPEAWRGGLVLIGALGATGLADDYWTPTSDVGRKMSGVEIHANVAASLFSSQFLRQASGPWEVAAIFAVVLLVALFTAHLGAVAAWLGTALVMATYALANAWALDTHGLLLPFTAPLLAAVLTFSACAAYRFSTAQRQARRLLNLATYESLHEPGTGLPNRTLLLRRMTLAMDPTSVEQHPAALLLFGIDGFREVNETLGHLAGDLMLGHVARELEALAPRLTVAPLASTVAGLGGHQFAVLLPGMDACAAVRAGLHLLARLQSTSPLLNGQEASVRSTLGIAAYPEHGEDPPTLLRRAELALSAARHAPSGYAVYTADQDEHAAERLALASSLRRAIDSDQLSLSYQPKVDCQSGALVGVEALARWRHPSLGEVPAQRFVALAEETGMICSLTRWALAAAVRQSRLWLDAGLRVPIAVNLSALDAQDASLPAAIAELLRQWDVPAELLAVEITESALLGQPDLARDVLLRLEGMGVFAALDDFGTGYSSLGYLKQFPVRELKIDRSFVADMAAAARDRTIVSSTITLGHSLGLVVVAEGVENRATLDLLRELGCDLVQGYHAGEPMPAADLQRWIAARVDDQRNWSAAA